MKSRDAAQAIRIFPCDKPAFSRWRAQNSRAVAETKAWSISPSAPPPPPRPPSRKPARVLSLYARREAHPDTHRTACKRALSPASVIVSISARRRQPPSRHSPLSTRAREPPELRPLVRMPDAALLSRAAAVDFANPRCSSRGPAHVARQPLGFFAAEFGATAVYPPLRSTTPSSERFSNLTTLPGDVESPSSSPRSRPRNVSCSIHLWQHTL